MSFCGWENHRSNVGDSAIYKSISFSKFIGAVKPRDRTPQYYLLAALYCLEAGNTPVSAREVGDLLRLHLRKDCPANINDLLRKNPAFATLENDQKPLRWTLTDEGVEKLRTLSGMALDSDTKSARFDYDVAIICALEKPEFSAVVDACGGEDAWEDIDDAVHTHSYRRAKLKTMQGLELRIVGTTSTSMGLTAAAIVTTQAVLLYKPRLVVMIGIAAGTRSGGKQFGDVLVADPSVDYNSGKVVEANGIREFQPDPYPIGLHARLRSVLQRYRTRYDVFEQIRAKWKGPKRLTNNL